ncbi:MerR family transcriptional regulator [Nocardiopsis sp. NPDC006139]|uniref:MerR family transcriptional regulator n=1 Tax=Nocardiopsis sp. NPDC006139 TaxID=3154578 RepID=UPI0033AD8E2A
MPFTHAAEIARIIRGAHGGPATTAQETGPMLTIGELASYAGVTVRAVRHYHAEGLLAEPERDRSGYRRYGADAVIELIRIRTLARAGVPLSRVRELLRADREGFAAAVDDIDARLEELADGLASYITGLAEEKGDAYVDDVDVEPTMAGLMDALAFDTVPQARRLIELLRGRGWSGWTRLARVEGDTGPR